MSRLGTLYTNVVDMRKYHTTLLVNCENRFRFTAFVLCTYLRTSRIRDGTSESNVKQIIYARRRLTSRLELYEYIRTLIRVCTDVRTIRNLFGNTLTKKNVRKASSPSCIVTDGRPARSLSTICTWDKTYIDECI